MGKVVLLKATDGLYTIPDPGTPKEVLDLDMFKDECLLKEDRSVQTITMDTTFNLISDTPCLSNKEMVEKLLLDMDESDAVSVESCNGVCRAIVEYIITDNRGVSIEHNSSVLIVEPKNVLIPLGVNSDNECVYRHALLFDIKFVISGAKKISPGIMRTLPEKFEIHVVNLSIYIAKEEAVGNVSSNTSVYGNRYSYQSPTIKQIVEDSVCIFDSTKSGYQLTAITQLRGIPSRTYLNFKLGFGDVADVYDDSTLTEMIRKNTQDLVTNVGVGGGDNDAQIVIDKVTGSGSGTSSESSEETSGS